MIGFGLLPSALPREPLEVTLRELPYREPFGAFLSLRKRFPYCFLLESGSGPEHMAEHTFIGFAPQRVLSLRGGRLIVDGIDAGPATDPLGFLREALPRAAMPPGEESVYLGGLVGFISYDFVSYLERLPERFDPGFPAFAMGLYLDGLVFHHRRKRCVYFSLGPDRFGQVEEALKRGGTPGAFALKDLRPHMSRKTFLEAVRVAKGYIRAGDVYQVVLSRRLSGRFCGDLAAAYARLRELNPSPYMYFLDFGDIRIAGSSPEMFLAARGRRLFTCPIAGTRPITGDPEVDEAYRVELLSDEKERAEHNMLVDLARNDIGRVSRFGTVQVTDYMVVERFSHVQHIVSRVEGELVDGLDAFDAMAALFPAGTVSGAPKVRAMEIIAELEPEPRGPYAGIVGYFSTTGDMDSAITIRTIFARGKTLYLQAGAGIVADSVPEREWDETQGKLGALLAALEIGGGR